MNINLLGAAKMRGSAWGLLLGLAAGIGAYIWAASNETPTRGRCGIARAVRKTTTPASARAAIFHSLSTKLL
jgi:hypothetical protein